MIPWFALYCTHALKAQRELHEASFETFCPTYKRLTYRRQHAILTSTPLLPGYVFARIAPRFSEAHTEHVAYVVSASGYPAPIPHALIEPLHDLVQSGRLDDQLPGTKARPRGVRRRGLAGLHAWFEAAEESVRAAA